MTISNALPIQFWPEGTPTFNDLDVCGINAICFCQPVQCDDEILIQFYEDTAFSSIGLYATYEDGSVDFIMEFSESPTDYWTASFVPLNEVDCPSVFSLVIANPLLIESLLAPNAGWNNGILAPFQALTATGFEFTGDGTMNDAFQAYTVPNGTTIEFDIVLSKAGTINVTYIEIGLYEDIGLTIEVGRWIDPDPPNTVGTKSVSILCTGNAQYIRLQALAPAGGGAGTATITIPVGQIFFIPDAAVLLRSDCIDVRTEHECTKLITYSNNSDFAGIDYNAQSPSPEFSLRVPAMLFRATRPEEQEVHPLSNDEWIRVWSRMTKKMKLELGFMPDYMHEKLQLIFMHDNVEIDGLSWKKRDPYELIEGDKRNPLMKANVLLTDKTFIKRNLI